MGNNILKAAYILTASMLLAGLATTAHSQALQQVADSYKQDTILREKLFVHTDRSTYVTGDIIWFKLYCVEAVSHQPLDMSKVAYVEIIDKAGNAVQQGKIELSKGFGSGSFTIPVSVSNGTYQLRAYTNWMKNFGAAYFFNKAITIVNPLVSPEQPAVAATTYDVRFFPEGGDLLGGVSNNIGFKVTASNGKDVAFSGAIINAKNDTLVRFKPLKFGMGRFALNPEKNAHYKAIINVDGKKITQDFLPVADNGYAMQLTEKQGGEINIGISTGNAGHLYLIAHNNAGATIAKETDITNGTAAFSIDKSKLSDGVNRITLFNQAKQPVAERLYFKRPQKQIAVYANTAARQYGTRKKIDVDVAAKDMSGRLLPANLSMAVYRVDSLQTTPLEDIDAYLWLRSDLKGNITSPGYYFSDTSATSAQAADNLMLTQGWRRFDQKSIAADKPVFDYLPELNGHLVTAKVVDAEGKPATGVVAYMGLPGKRVQLYTAISDATGKLLFNTKQLYGPGEVVVQTNTLIDSTSKLEVVSPFFEQHANLSLPPFTLLPAMQRALQEQSLSMQVQNVYTGNKLKRTYDLQVDSAAFYGTPYSAYKLDDFTRFTLMEEVIKEYVKEAFVTNSKNYFHIKLINQKGLLDRDPLVLFDGVPVFNMNKVFALDPLKIRRLEILPFRYYLGPAGFEGVMSFTTYKGDLGGTEMDPHAVVLDYEGMQLQREFYTPRYDTDEQVKTRMPDFRKLLYWKPVVLTNAKGNTPVSFYTSDIKGTFVGVLQGITQDGRANAQTFQFVVN